MTTDELIAKLEAATGADRELDLAIGGMLTAGERGLWQMMYTHPESAPRYTGSVDAALTLVPEGLEWLVRTPFKNSVKRHSEFLCNITMPDMHPGEEFSEGWGSTAALAICIAALRARTPRGTEG